MLFGESLVGGVEWDVFLLFCGEGSGWKWVEEWGWSNEKWRGGIME